MNAVKLWIAIHPGDPLAFEVSLSEPREFGVWIYPNTNSIPAEFVPFVEYAAIPLTKVFT